MAKQEIKKRITIAGFSLYVCVKFMQSLMLSLASIFFIIPIVNLFVLKSDDFTYWYSTKNDMCFNDFKTEYKLVKRTTVREEIWEKV